MIGKSKYQMCETLVWVFQTGVYFLIVVKIKQNDVNNVEFYQTRNRDESV